MNTEEYSEHTEHMFCSDPSCPCHEDKYLIAEVEEAYYEGELTAAEATRTVEGKMV